MHERALHHQLPVREERGKQDSGAKHGEERGLEEAERLLLVGARIGLETDNWRVGLYGRNLTNEDSSPGATRWLHSYLIGIASTAGPAATLDPGLPSTAVAAYSLPRGIFGILRRERQVGIDFSYNF